MYTSWTEPNSEFEDAVSRFIDNLLGSSLFLESFYELLAKASDAAKLTALAQLVLRMTLPGTPFSLLAHSSDR